MTDQDRDKNRETTGDPNPQRPYQTGGRDNPSGTESNPGRKADGTSEVTEDDEEDDEDIENG